jgi:DNA/RNA-binding domain of Phe-tRNA-synthetase-like protein
MKLPDIRFSVGRNDLSISSIGLDNCTVEPSRNDWTEYEQSVFRIIRKSTRPDDIKDDPLFRSYRDLYWSFGMDPTKIRVSSEALLRRILNGENLWRISNVVDVANLASAYHKLPIGLIDASKIEGELVVRSAEKGEVFTRIGGTIRECNGREIVRAYDTKIVCFGFATHDSDFTKVTKATTAVIVLLYGAASVTMEYLDTSTYDTLSMMLNWIDCKPSGIQFYKC